MPTRKSYSRFPLLALAILSLLAAIWGGLLRLGWEIPPLRPGLTLVHGPLMICGFLGTLISLERAVAIARKPAFAAPLLTGIGVIALLAGAPDPAGPILITAGSAGLLWSFAVILGRQMTLFSVTMGLGAVAWFAGNCFWLMAVPIPLMVFWWAAFLVLTIMGERLELSRMAPAHRLKTPLFALATAIYLGGILLASFLLIAGVRLAGAGMVALACWLAEYDLAWRTVKLEGLTRFMAANLLSGYVWLGVSGLLWMAFAGSLAGYRYDAMMHSLFLGFVFSMIFAHAPIIFPAVTGIPIPFRRGFYIHVIILHLSLLLRIVGGDLIGSLQAYQWGGLLNVFALLVFLVNTAYALASGIHQNSLRPPALSP